MVYRRCSERQAFKEPGVGLARRQLLRERRQRPRLKLRLPLLRPRGTSAAATVADDDQPANPRILLSPSPSSPPPWFCKRLTFVFLVKEVKRCIVLNVNKMSCSAKKKPHLENEIAIRWFSLFFRSVQLNLAQTHFNKFGKIILYTKVFLIANIWLSKPFTKT